MRSEDGHHVTTATSQFNFPQILLYSIACDLDGESLSPFPSPIISPLGDKEFDGLADLSPLTSPEPTPPPSPQPSAPLSLPPPPLPRTSTSSKKKRPKSAHRKARLQEAQTDWRKRRRIVEKEAVTGHYQGRSAARKKYVDSAELVICGWATEKAAVASTAFVALDDVSKSRRTYRLDEVVGEQSKLKFRLVKWDGRKPVALVDASQRIIGAMAGHPDDKDWPRLHLQAAEALENRRQRCHVPRKHRKHRRGPFPALRCGISHGGGQQEPGNLRNDSPNREILEELNAMEPFKRLAGFASSVMSTWAPNLHKYYSETIDDLHKNHPSLTRIFPSSVFSAVSYNFGPRTVCFKHQDFANLPFGWCAVTSLGSFDPTQGGHLILWDLQLALEFPPGSTILLPSSIVAHSNTTIAKEERRYSFAQYTAGGIFRWVDNNCMTRQTYLSSLSPEQLKDDDARNAARWMYGLSLFHRIEKPKKAAVLEKDPVS